MGAAQGDLAGAEIVEQGPGALHLCKVRVFLALTERTRLYSVALERYDRRVFKAEEQQCLFNWASAI